MGNCDEVQETNIVKPWYTLPNTFCSLSKHNLSSHLKKKKVVYLASSVLSCDTQVLHCTRWHLRCGVWPLQLCWVCRLSCGFQNTQASVVAEGGLGCSIVCGILVPQPGIQPMYPALQGGSLTAGPPGKSRSPHFCDNLPLAFLYNFIFHINFKIYFLIKALWWFSH